MTDNPLDSLLFDENDILERVDEYSLYCRYLGFQPLIGGKYKSPIRPGDDDPSFGLFERKYGHGSHEYLWKDQALGIHGDIFKLIQLMFMVKGKRMTSFQVLQQICADFGLGGIKHQVEKIVQFEAQFTEDIDISIISKKFTPRDLEYWQLYNVTPPTLNLYQTTSLAAYYLTANQSVPAFPKGLGYAYRIYDRYQLYFPFAEKKRKFRNNWTEVCVPGYLQLQYKSPLLIVTKAFKDIMSLHSFGYEAISPRGENILLPEPCIKAIQRKYSYIVTLFDNDGKHKAAEYPFKELHVPIDSGEKDVTDFCAHYGPQQTAEMLSLILNS